MKKMLYVLTSVLVFVGLSVQVSASEDADELQEALQSFQQFVIVDDLNIQVPTVVEVPLTLKRDSIQNLLVVDEKNSQPQPYYFFSKSKVLEPEITITDTKANMDTNRLSDGGYSTFVEYSLGDNGEPGRAELHITSKAPFKASSLSLYLHKNIALPKTIEIRALESGGEKVILAKSPLSSRFVSFPETTAQTFVVILEYSQILRLTEVSLAMEDLQKDTYSAVRFLAQPQEEYRIYYDTDRHISLKTGESGNLHDDKGVLQYAKKSVQTNVQYKESDIDEDGIPDEQDNCVTEKNEDQQDIDKNGRGDACDDFDKDGVINAQDNCPNQPNKWQRDEDVDGVGDVCDQEESRFLEKYQWIPWVSIMAVGILVGFLLVRMVKTDKNKSE